MPEGSPTIERSVVSSSGAVLSFTNKDFELQIDASAVGLGAVCSGVCKQKSDPC